MISEYKEKLKDTVQQGIVYTTGITDFELFIAKSIEIDQVLYKIAKASTKKDESCSQKRVSKDSIPSQRKNVSSSFHSKDSIRKTCLLPTLLPHDLSPYLVLHPQVALYPKRNKHATKPIISACTAVIEITRSKIAPVSEVQLRKATPNPAMLYLLYLLHYLPRPSPLFPPQETPHLRAPNDRITEGHHLGYFVDFIA